MAENGKQESRGPGNYFSGKSADTNPAEKSAETPDAAAPHHIIAGEVPVEPSTKEKLNFTPGTEQQPKQGTAHPQEKQQPKQGTAHPQEKQQPKQGTAHPQGKQQPKQGAARPQGQQPPKQGAARPQGKQQPKQGAARPQGKQQPKQSAARPQGQQPPKQGAVHPQGKQQPKQSAARPQGKQHASAPGQNAGPARTAQSVSPDWKQQRANMKPYTEELSRRAAKSDGRKPQQKAMRRPGAFWSFVLPLQGDSASTLIKKGIIIISVLVILVCIIALGVDSARVTAEIAAGTAGTGTFLQLGASQALAAILIP